MHAESTRSLSKWNRLFRWSLVTACVVAVIGLACAWWVGGKLLESANRPIGAPPDAFRFEAVTFPSESGTDVAAWVSIAEESHALVILAHPIRGSRRAMLDRAKMLRDAGYSTLLVDLQAHGESKGQRITLGDLERHDITAAIEYAHRRCPGQRLAIIGWSLGGAAAVLAAPLDIDALVLESVYSEVREAIHNRLKMRVGPLRHVAAPALLMQLSPRLGVSASDLRPVARIADVTCPVLIVAGTLDQHTTIAESRELFRAANEPKEMCEFEGASHEDLYRFDADLYRQTVIEFLDRWTSKS